MLSTMGYSSMDQLLDKAIPSSIRKSEPLKLGPPRGEAEMLSEFRGMMSKNKVLRSHIGMG